MTDSPEVEERKRRSFDAVARAYEVERPGYPDALFDDLLSLTHLGPDARVLEIGCGTGKATRSLLRRGLRVTAIELGASLAAVAREVLGGDQLTVHVGRFEEWDAPVAAFDLALSAQAYHWLDAELAGPKVAHALVPGGVLACFWNMVVEHVDWLTQIYVEHAPEMRFDEPEPRYEARVKHAREHIEKGGALEVFEERRYPWTLRKRADDYVRLIDTYSDHRILCDETRARLYPAIRTAIEERGGLLERPQVAHLLLARPRARG